MSGKMRSKEGNDGSLETAVERTLVLCKTTILNGKRSAPI